MRLTIDDVLRLSRLPQPVDSRLWGRDESNPYYDFLYHLTRHIKPKLVVELGTCEGGGTVHLACGGAEKVITIDCEQRPATVAKLSALPNVECWEAGSVNEETLERIAEMDPIDMLFVDTLHTPSQVASELDQYLPLLSDNGLILFDDIEIDAAMKTWWNSVKGKKVSLPWLHPSGFGALLLCSST